MGIRLNYLYLVASFAIGLAVMMLTIPKPRVVLKFPSPDNADSHVYKGSDNACYKISADEEDCPADGKHVRSQPVSSDIDETKEGWGLAGMLSP
jgi:hypothetical protein